MRSRKAANEHVAEIARRRLELLSAELAAAGRPATGGAGEPDESEPDDAACEPGDGKDSVAPAKAGALGGARPGRHARRSVGLSGRTLGWLHDRLPPTLQGRVQLGATHLTVVALLVAAALAVTAWWVVRANAPGTVVPDASNANDEVPSLPLATTAATSAPVAASARPATGPPSSSSSPVVIIDVAGKVRRPGIVTLPLGSRVVDAVEAAGGARRGVDVTALNLARLLVDGEQIVVGVPPPGGVAAPAASAPSGASGAGPLVNLNTATQEQLETLPGVGPVTAAAIMQWRTDNGAFSTVDELLEVSGIGDATLAELAPFVTL